MYVLEPAHKLVLIVLSLFLIYFSDIMSYFYYTSSIVDATGTGAPHLPDLCFKAFHFYSFRNYESQKLNVLEVISEY